MFYGKRTAGLVIAVISLAILSLPAAANAGETDTAAGVTVEDAYVQTGTQNTPASSSGETDSHAVEQDNQSAVLDRIVYFDGMGETDQHAGIRVENALVQTGTLAFAANSSGETDSYGLEINIAAPVQEFFVYADGMGETDQFANVNGGNDFASGIRLTRADIANAEVAVGGGNDERIVSVLAGETDQSAGIVMVEASISSGEVYVLLREPDTDPDVT
ncbi:MAG: hypothetical protein IIC28_04685 [Chloroflexi bacterium]|nr:hypothetical protein [Chloroflexota bacterium]